MKMIYDCLVIGAGIAGITASIYLKRGNKSSLMLDKGAPGGKLNNIHRIDNYPGVARIAGPDLAMSLFNQASELGVEYAYGSVYEIRKEDNVFLVKTDAGDFNAKSLIIATGVENKKLGIPGEDKYLGKGVSYCATCDGPFFKGKDVALVGNADHAVEDAIYLSDIVNRLYFLYPEEIVATPSHIEELIEKDNVTWIAMDKSIAIEGNELVESFTYEDKDGQHKLDVNAVFPLYGEKSSTAFLSPLGVKGNKGFIETNANMESNVPGLFAAGDIVDKKLRQLVNAAGEGAIAATSAIGYLRELPKE